MNQKQKNKMGDLVNRIANEKDIKPSFLIDFGLTDIILKLEYYKDGDPHLLACDITVNEDGLISDVFGHVDSLDNSKWILSELKETESDDLKIKISRNDINKLCQFLIYCTMGSKTIPNIDNKLMHLAIDIVYSPEYKLKLKLK